MAEFSQRRYLLMTTDPVHIGTGGYRLGRVDNSIVREPGTNLPKIPGTSLHGAIRAYAARVYGTPDAAGQDHSNVTDIRDNPVCRTFGFIEKRTINSSTSGNEFGDDDEAAGFSGVINVFDAQILLFPVQSLAGPVWVTTPSRLDDASFTVKGLPDPWTEDFVLCSFAHSGALNLGWLLLNAHVSTIAVEPPEWDNEPAWQAVRNKIVIVPDSLFSHVVNSNLEVRTSVSIDPLRGAAASGALFTYEAIPRATFLTMDVVQDDFYVGQDTPFPEARTTAQGTELPLDKHWKSAFDVFDAGLALIAWLGVGGMGTRGFGRLQTIGAPIKLDYGRAF